MWLDGETPEEVIHLPEALLNSLEASQSSESILHWFVKFIHLSLHHKFSRWNTQVLCEVIQSDELLVPEHIDQRYMVIPTERMTECLWHFTTRERNEEFKAVTCTYATERKAFFIYPFSSSFSLLEYKREVSLPQSFHWVFWTSLVEVAIFMTGRIAAYYADAFRKAGGMVGRFWRLRPKVKTGRFFWEKSVKILEISTDL